MALARELRDVDRVGVVPGERAQPLDRRFAHVVVLVPRQLLERVAVLDLRRRAGRVQAQLPNPGAGELRQHRRAARRHGGGERDQRVRGTVPAARRAGARQIADRALERGDGVGRRAARAQLIQREQRDVDVAIAGGGERCGA